VTDEWRKFSEELHNLYSSQNIIRQIKWRENEVDDACGTHGREECTRFWWESPKERDHSEDQGVDERMGSKWILGRLAGGVEYIQLAQNRDRWRSVVNTVMNIRVLVQRI
jgi:hypothetical protein